MDRAARVQHLGELLRNGREDKYDCVIGVSGGKDSTRQALWIRDRLHLRPLLVCVSYPPELMTSIGVNNLENLSKLGFDIELLQPGPSTARRLMFDSFETSLNLLRANEIALVSGVQRAAVTRNIPSVVWGENPALHVGDLGALGVDEWDGNALSGMNTISGGDLSWLSNASLLAENLRMYQFPPAEKSQDYNVFYLDYALDDWDFVDNAIIAGLGGVSYRDDGRNSGDPFGVTAVDENVTPVNQMLKYWKYGFGRATEYANEAIRRGRLSREAAITMIREFDGKCDSYYVESVCDYLQLPVDAFWEKALQAVNLRLFSVSGRSVRPRFEIGRGIVR